MGIAEAPRTLECYLLEVDMSTSEAPAGRDPISGDAEPAKDQGRPDQEPTAHPNGERQAEENMQNESPG